MEPRGEVTDAEGRAWLKQNGARDDVVTRASGLQYRVPFPGFLSSGYSVCDLG